MKRMTLLLLTTVISCFPFAEVRAADPNADLSEKLNQYVPVELTTDLTKLSSKQKRMLPLLFRAANIMERCFWFESYGYPESLMRDLHDEKAREFAEINYGPWDRLNGNEPFVAGFGAKPLGANFYPTDMTREEFENANLPGKAGLYTFLRRDSDNALITVPYREAFASEMREASELLLQAAELADDPGLARYLKLRADALLTDDYQPSDLAWLEMKNNTIDVVIGPIETYEDKLFGYKAAHTCYILIKDKAWSEKLARYSEFLPALQASLPVPMVYRSETPGTDTDLNAYDVIYYAGDCNSGSKTIAINLPNDEDVQLQKGTRRLQLKNAMEAKFEKILLPIADQLIADDQRSHVTFDAFFSNTMFHEVAHGLGIKNTIDGQGSVRKALKEHSGAIEEGKADILGLFMIQQLHEQGEIEADLEDYYVTFMAGIFRSVRFGASSAHGKANMIRFNFFRDFGAFQRQADGKYRVNVERFGKATEALSNLLLTVQGDGDYAEAARLVQEKGVIGDQLAGELSLLEKQGIPVDVVFEQSLGVLGLE
ncbi:hypothetical protein N9M41_00900 [Rhodopirellula sp.]|nr:hypothetical protein [Rhodopirellula sp.]